MTTLEDLRKANLREQRGEPAPAPPKAEPAAVETAKPMESVAETPKAAAVETAPSKAEAPNVADLTEHGLTIETAAPVGPVKSPSPAARPSPVPIVKPAAAAAPPSVDVLAVRIRAAVLKKRLIPAGVKATVDMSPELFWRAKRYCHDHSNATLRQLMLEVLTTFLDEEGY